MKHEYSKNGAVLVPGTYRVLVRVPVRLHAYRIRQTVSRYVWENWYGLGTLWVRRDLLNSCNGKLLVFFCVDICNLLFSDLDKKFYLSREQRIETFHVKNNYRDLCYDPEFVSCSIYCLLIGVDFPVPWKFACIRLPRLYNVYKSMGTVTSFQNILDNVFIPLFEVTVDPNSHPQLHVFLMQECSGRNVASMPTKPKSWYLQLCLSVTCSSSFALHGNYNKALLSDLPQWDKKLGWFFTWAIDLTLTLYNQPWDQLRLRNLEDLQLKALKWLKSTASANRYLIKEYESVGYKHPLTGLHLDLHRDNLLLYPFPLVQNSVVYDINLCGGCLECT
ncbi:hypothetical protein TEA_008245 [Camellia sinensis var. sinensis]|uniref:Uncharacterized protein n=1 Tax=Camellia sinensis var. sinensis TaxID=542762 RepID=A0A4S4DG12_CAMSN|nr:hypothetical protein TEA_008245 [Camellia sinensis var. sinensis]